MVPITAYKHAFQLFFPSECRCKKLLPVELTEKIFIEAAEKMRDWFGGNTDIKDAIGRYINENGVPAEEEVKSLISYANDEAYLAHYNDFCDYARELADRLTQESMGCRVDKEMHFMPMTARQCVHGQKFDPPIDKEILAKKKPFYLRLALRHTLIILEDEQSARQLVTTFWKYSTCDELIRIDKWPAGARILIDDQFPPQMIANHNGFHVAYIRMKSEELKNSDEREIIQEMHDQVTPWHGLFLFSNLSGSIWHFVNVKHKDPSSPTSPLVLRRLPIRRKAPSNAVVRSLAALDLENIGRECSGETIQAAHDQAFDTQGLTNEFFQLYKQIFEEVQKKIEGFGKDANNNNFFTQSLFNRLLFVAFIQKKGWLKFSGSADYLIALWNNYQQTKIESSNFYNDRLKPLFFDALNKPVADRPAIRDLIGDVPYLNGGLFAHSEVDIIEGIFVPDECIKQILQDLFAKFDFSISENTDLEQEIAVDPEMLGHVFEKLVVNRVEKGAYYTPKPVVNYMCREGLKKYLSTAVPDEKIEAIEHFVDLNNPGALADREAVYDALEAVKVCDLACGSGAYLFGMLQVLIELRSHIFEANLVAAKMAYKRKLHIIQNNLYGVDLDRVAVNIARLRLWLSLAVEYEDGDPPLMPNLDFKIEVGNSLTAPSPSIGQIGLFRNQLVRFSDDLQFLRSQYFVASEVEKAALQLKIREAEDSAQGELKDVEPLPDGAFDWRIRFADVFINGGFDIILANPPYVKAGNFSNDRAAMKKVYNNYFDGNADLYVYFYYRALQLLKDKGVFVFISSNKWVQNNYGARLRKELLAKTGISAIVNFGSLDVFKGVAAYPLIITAQKGAPRPHLIQYTRVKDLNAPYPDIRKIVQGQRWNLDISRLSEKPWDLTDPDTTKKLAQIITGRKTLEGYLKERKLEIQSGIKTGCDEAFRVAQDLHDALIAEDPTSAELMVPLIRGRNIDRWRINHTGSWLILTPNAREQAQLGRPPIHIEEYPAIYRHLLAHKTALEARSDRGDQWWNLRKCAYYPIFGRPKILYQEIATYPRFAMDESGSYTNNKVMIIPSGDLYLLGILNSSTAWEFLNAKCSQLRGNTISLQIPSLSLLPIPEATEQQRAHIEALVRRCINAAPNAAGASQKSPAVLDDKEEPVKAISVARGALEQELDAEVARLYGVSG